MGGRKSVRKDDGKTQTDKNPVSHKECFGERTYRGNFATKESGIRRIKIRCNVSCLGSLSVRLFHILVTFNKENLISWPLLEYRSPQKSYKPHMLMFSIVLFFVV